MRWIVAPAAAVCILAGLGWSQRESTAAPPGARRAGVPRLVDLGAKTCIPCKLMAPILDGLTRDFAGKLEVKFIDVWQRANAPLARKYGVRTIPTQIFLDASGKELWRHEGYISRYGILDKWRELGYPFADKALAPTLARMTPAKADKRPADRMCFLCDGDVAARSRVLVRTDEGDVRLCGPHHYCVMYSCLTADKVGLDEKVSVTDWATGKAISATSAVYLYG
ncbi:MAG: thioredoxin family protein, partial [Planctomycetota bacterium]